MPSFLKLLLSRLFGFLIVIFLAMPFGVINASAIDNYDRKQFDQAFRESYLNIILKEGSSEDEYVLGMIYLNGLGSSVTDPITALKYLELAAQKDHFRATLALAQEHFQGAKIRKDLPKALSFFKKAESLSNQSFAKEIAEISNSISGGEITKNACVNALDASKQKVAEQYNFAAKCLAEGVGFKNNGSQEKERLIIMLGKNGGLEVLKIYAKEVANRDNELELANQLSKIMVIDGVDRELRSNINSLLEAANMQIDLKLTNSPSPDYIDKALITVSNGNCNIAKRALNAIDTKTMQEALRRNKIDRSKCKNDPVIKSLNPITVSKKLLPQQEQDLKSLCNEGVRNFCLLLGRAHLKGMTGITEKMDVKKRERLALPVFQIAVDQGSLEGHIDVAKILADGGKREKAMSILQNAINQGNVEALFHLAAIKLKSLWSANEETCAPLRQYLAKATISNPSYEEAVMLMGSKCN